MYRNLNEFELINGRVFAPDSSGTMAGVSLWGEDELLTDLDDLRDGLHVEIGTEEFFVRDSAIEREAVE